jgi:hypothetical protein
MSKLTSIKCGEFSLMFSEKEKFRIYFSPTLVRDWNTFLATLTKQLEGIDWTQGLDETSVYDFPLAFAQEIIDNHNNIVEEMVSHFYIKMKSKFGASTKQILTKLLELENNF